MRNTSIFSFIILNLVKKGVLDFNVTTATDICMKEAIYGSLRRAIWRKSMETLKRSMVTTTVLNLVSKFAPFVKHFVHSSQSVESQQKNHN